MALLRLHYRIVENRRHCEKPSSGLYCHCKLFMRSHCGKFEELREFEKLIFSRFAIVLPELLQTLVCRVIPFERKQRQSKRVSVQKTNLESI